MANPTTAETKKATKAKASEANPEHEAWLAAIDYGAEEWQRYFAPGEWGTLAAKAWGCSVDEALERTIELLEAGRLEPVVDTGHSQSSFEFRVHNKPLRSGHRVESANVRAALVELADADGSKPYNTAGRVDIVLLAFGKLVPRSFELYPAPRKN